MILLTQKTFVLFAAPDAAPIITESVSPTSTSIMVTWSPPSPEKRNGILTDYIIRYTNDVKLPKTMWQMTATPNTSITLTGLSIFTEYTVAVAATTEAGVGPDDSVTVRTLNDSKCAEYTCIHISSGFLLQPAVNHLQ